MAPVDGFFSKDFGVNVGTKIRKPVDVEGWKIWAGVAQHSLRG